MVVTRRWGTGVGRGWGKVNQSNSSIGLSFGVLLQGRVTIANNNALYIQKARRTYFECFPHKEMMNLHEDRHVNPNLTLRNTHVYIFVCVYTQNITRCTVNTENFCVLCIRLRSKFKLNN
jgi:hypothetical protein